MQTIFCEEKIEIDGFLDEAIWQVAPKVSNFIIYDPEIGVSSGFRTEVMTCYTDQAFYVAAILYDPAPDSILREVTIRNNRNGNADAFMVEINAYNDHQNAFMFFVTAANVQSDLRLSGNSEDEAWNAVWLSETTITGDGWVVEMLIPFSQLRIPGKVEQEWGINFRRMVRRTREFSSWNPINKETGEATVQAGLLYGIKNIAPPLRLAFFPYISSYLQQSPNLANPDYTFAGGMDVKYGIDESFTLDMTLIPDFGQTITDQIVLNLSPYEIYYNENRAFFTEGTELFNKMGLFYSRRVGKEPMYAGKVEKNLEDGEIIENNPREGALINATKFSGRLANGLGIGVFNAMSNRTYATIRKADGDIRKELTDPFSNYNILVLDQAMRNNSYINLINTNVYRPEIDSTANVSGLGIRLMDKRNLYGIEFNTALSHKRGQAMNNGQTGHYLNGRIGKFNGRINFSYYWDLLSDQYDANDMSYLAFNNLVSHGIEATYKKFSPGAYLLTIRSTTGIQYQHIYSTGNYALLELYSSGVISFKNYLSLGWNGTLQPLGYHDYFEPRVPNRYYFQPALFALTGWISSDYRKKIALDINAGFSQDLRFTDTYYITISPRFRLSNHIFLVPRVQVNRALNELGYLRHYSPDSIILGVRDNTAIINSLQASFVLNNKTAISLDFRHLNNLVDYKSYQFLEDNGNIVPYSDSNFMDDTRDINYNVFSVDLVLSWNFAPGSFLNLAWKNFILPKTHSDLSPGYWENTLQTIRAEQSNSLSFKLIYYVDYHFFRL